MLTTPPLDEKWVDNFNAAGMSLCMANATKDTSGTGVDDVADKTFSKNSLPGGNLGDVLNANLHKPNWHQPLTLPGLTSTILRPLPSSLTRGVSSLTVPWSAGIHQVQ